MAKLSVQDFAKVFYELTNEYDNENLDLALRYFIEELYKRKMLGKFEAIIEEHEIHKKRMETDDLVEISSAAELDYSLIKKIKSALGNEVKVITKLDPHMIGGIKIRIGNKIFDGSLKTSISNLKQQIF